VKTVPPNVELLALAEALESVMPRWVILPQTSRLTSTAWDGDARSTTGSTLIDMSSVFGSPSNVDAVLLRVAVRDSGSSGTHCYIRFDNAAPGGTSSAVNCPSVNDKWADQQLTVPTNSDGDIYFDCVASGAGTLDVYVHVHGYHLR